MTDPLKAAFAGPIGGEREFDRAVIAAYRRRRERRRLTLHIGALALSGLLIAGLALFLPALLDQVGSARSTLAVGMTLICTALLTAKTPPVRSGDR